MLKENHVFVKNAHTGASQLFKQIVNMLKEAIWDDSMSNEENVSLVEVLLYERVGLYLLRQLQSAYVDEEF